MSDPVRFTLDGKDVEAGSEETIWQVARRGGSEIPYLCYTSEPGYRADGNCRACMVEIEGERVLAASCLRKPTEGMKVHSANDRARTAQRMVVELLLADQPVREVAHDRDSHFWQQAHGLGVSDSRFPHRETHAPDASHPAMRVALDACINCNLCVRACREVQVNDVIGMAFRGHRAKIVFDQDDPMGASSCVACGECVQACPTGALMPATLVDAQGVGTSQGLDEVDSVCPFCGVGCLLSYQVKDNKIAAVTGRAGPANENRLCVKGRFGFDYIYSPQRLTKPLIRREDAPKCVDVDLDPKSPLTHFREATWEEALDLAAKGLNDIRDRDGGNALSGFGSAKCSNEEAYLFQKLVRTGFGTNNLDHCTRLCHASSVAALLEGVGSGAVSAPFRAAKDADFVMVIGANPTENHPVAATYFKQAAKTGALVVMDPRGMALKRHATHMLQFRPGSDVAMLNAMLNVIVAEALYDQDYIDAHTEGFESLKAHIVDFTPEAMAPICGIDAETLRTVARKYATAKASIIFWGMGVSQHIHGTDNCRCLIALALITGQVGRPGTGLHPLRGQNNVQGASDAGLIPMMYPNYQLVESTEVRRRFEDIFLTETAFHADVVLPASAWPEKDGTVTNTNRQVQRGRKAVALPGDARQDWWITNELAQRIGCDWSFSHPSEIFAEMASVMPSLDNISWERVSAEESVTYPCSAPDLPGDEIVFGDGFPTPNGRGKLVPVSIIPPDEVPDDSFPMVLTTGRQLEHWHTGAMTRRATVLDELEPEAVATLAPGDMSRMGIAPGSMVRVSTRRGVLELRARADGAIPGGMVFIPFCYAEAPANVLTNQALDPFGKIPEFKFCAAKVEAV
jgi:formate dehydrogenase major subunit